jgi:hypothetical protein
MATWNLAFLIIIPVGNVLNMLDFIRQIRFDENDQRDTNDIKNTNSLELCER